MTEKEFFEGIALFDSREYYGKANDGRALSVHEHLFGREYYGMQSYRTNKGVWIHELYKRPLYKRIHSINFVHYTFGEMVIPNLTALNSKRILYILYKKLDTIVNYEPYDKRSRDYYDQFNKVKEMLGMI